MYRQASLRPRLANLELERVRSLKEAREQQIRLDSDTCIDPWEERSREEGGEREGGTEPRSGGGGRSM